MRRSTAPDDATPEVGVNVDRYGNPISVAPDVDPDDYSYELETMCWLQQERRTEPGQAGEMSDTYWTIFLAPDIAVDTTDAIEVDGYGRFEFVGDPWLAKQGSERMWHVEGTLRRTGEGVLAS